MDADDYIKTRVDGQISWFSKKGTSNKRAHISCRIVEILCAALIPLLAGYSKEFSPYVPALIGVLGVVVATCAGISAVLRLQEQWIKYRSTAEALKKEKYFFLGKVAPYDVAEPLPLLVQRVETLVAQENTNWAELMKKPDPSGKPTAH